MIRLFTAMSLLVLCVVSSVQAQTWQKPEIIEISSSADGEVEMTVVVDRGTTFFLMFPVINIYHADGTKMEIDDDFSLLTADGDAFWESGWSPNYLWERQTLPVEVSISGLSSGDASFYVTVEERDRTNTASDESDIATVTVAGTNANPDDVQIMFSVNTASSVADDVATVSVAAYPNPASSAIRFDAPVESGTVSVQVLDMRGATVMSQQATVSAGVCNLNVATLVPGTYVAVVADGTQQSQTRFVVAR